MNHTSVLNNDPGKTTDISFIITSYNSERNIQQCLFSVIEAIKRSGIDKTFPHSPTAEILVVDLGSTDSTIQRVSAFSIAENNIQVIQRKNSTIYQAKKTGVKKARGDWLVFLAAEDWVQKDFIKKLFNPTLETGADVICCNSIKTSEDGKIKFSSIKKETTIFQMKPLLKEFFSDPKCLYTCQAKIFRKSLVEGSFSRPHVEQEDALLVLQCISQKAVFHLIPYIGYHIGTSRDDSCLNRDCSEQLKKHLHTLEYLADLCQNNALEYYAEVNDRIVEILDLYISSLLNSEHSENYKTVIRLVMYYRKYIIGPHKKKTQPYHRLLFYYRTPIFATFFMKNFLRMKNYLHLTD